MREPCRVQSAVDSIWAALDGAAARAIGRLAEIERLAEAVRRGEPGAMLDIERSARSSRRETEEAEKLSRRLLTLSGSGYSGVDMAAACECGRLAERVKQGDSAVQSTAAWARRNQGDTK